MADTELFYAPDASERVGALFRKFSGAKAVPPALGLNARRLKQRTPATCSTKLGMHHTGTDTDALILPYRAQR